MTGVDEPRMAVESLIQALEQQTRKVGIRKSARRRGGSLAPGSAKFITNPCFIVFKSNP